MLGLMIVLLFPEHRTASLNTEGSTPLLRKITLPTDWNDNRNTTTQSTSLETSDIETLTTNKVSFANLEENDE